MAEELLNTIGPDDEEVEETTEAPVEGGEETPAEGEATEAPAEGGEEAPAEGGEETAEEETTEEV